MVSQLPLTFVLAVEGAGKGTWIDRRNSDQSKVGSPQELVLAEGVECRVFTPKRYMQGVRFEQPGSSNIEQKSNGDGSA
jgi:hypothetical protein